MTTRHLDRDVSAFFAGDQGELAHPAYGHLEPYFDRVAADFGVSTAGQVAVQGAPPMWKRTAEAVKLLEYRLLAL